MIVLCGLLEQDGKILFLEKNSMLEVPHTLGSIQTDPMSQLAEAFKKQTDIRVNVEGVFLQTKHIISGEETQFIVFKMVSLEEYQHQKYLWLNFNEAKQRKLGRSTQWLKDV
ncbi:Uncharacterised protein [Candidatus Bilamarchaeum dharawalense]|uniref:Nudix hydrolase domain-containing protein n=1 Tax=Candidatus Bilamarchaeum dharawalense TaxID=2885759 RepID=A0A5E4LTP6_9ARCH|nr:Uncharacterised protein [Candidatus Bilamarchaeum dharawalense]